MTLKKTKIPFVQTNQFSKLFIDYITGHENLKQLYKHLPEIDSFKPIIKEQIYENVNRELLVEVINKQYKSTQLPSPGTQVLLNKNTFTVCTGHQLCLFTGPLYFIYKIISTINLSEELKEKYPDYNFVPVYWMASEDHDFEEISFINLFGKKIFWNNPNAKGAVGRLKTDSLIEVLKEFQHILGASENANKLVELFHTAYLKQDNLANATRHIINDLFNEYGLIVVDGDDEQLKKGFSGFIKDDILNNTNYQLVNESISILKKLGYEAQVKPREINCFYIKDALRERIEKKGNEFHVLNTAIKFSKEELIKELEMHPEHFSPNVVLRPLYQQYVLPNIAYVGGPGELAYWLEYKLMFDHHQINYPLLIPRNFALLTDAKTTQQIEKLGLTMNDFFLDTESIIKKFVNRNTQENLHLQEEIEKLTILFTAVSEKAIRVDATLKGTVEAEMQKTVNSIKNMESKIIRAEKQKHETSINQIKKIKDKFVPNNSLQERFDNIAPYYIKLGKELIPSLKELFAPFEYKILIIEM